MSPASVIQERHGATRGQHRHQRRAGWRYGDARPQAAHYPQLLEKDKVTIVYRSDPVN